MKKIIAIFCVFALVLSLSACGSKNVDSNTSNAVTNSFKENGVSIETTAFPENTVLKVQTIPENDAKISAIKTAVPLASEIIAYEITATNDNVTVQPNGTVEVVFPFPANFNKDLQTATVYYVADTGNVEAMPTTVGAGSITAILSHFSTYAVVVTAKTVESDVISSDVSSVVSDVTSIVESSPESQPNTSIESTPQPTPEPTISVEKKSFKMFKRVNDDIVNQIELTFGNNDNNNFSIMVEVGDSVEKNMKISAKILKVLILMKSF